MLSRRVRRHQLVAAVAHLSPCVIGMEACASAHHWGRVFEKLGHRVRLMSPQYVKPYVKTNKNDGRDAEAICEAVSRPTMRFVPIKTVDQTDLQALHRARSLLIKTRTAVINQIRGLLGEYGVVLARSPEEVRPALVKLMDDEQTDLTAFARATFSELYEQLVDVEQRLAKVTARLEGVFRVHPVCRQLATVPGIGPLTAASSAWLGLVPRHCSSGGRTRVAGLSKRGNRYLRTLLIHGARAVVRRAEHRPGAQGRWMGELKRRRGSNVAAVAVANKNARVVWALLAHDDVYRPSA